jgi:uncharacterized SAM-binding protein YcdF (DUF218 family)
MYEDYEFDGKESGASTIVGVLILCLVILGGAYGLIYYLQGAFAGRQFLGAILSPVGFIWLALLVGAMVATFTKQRFMAAVLWLSMIGMSLVGNSTISNNLVAGLEATHQPVEIGSLEEMQYGFVLGGAARVVKNRQIDLNSAGERVTDAIRMHKAGKIKHLVFTGSPFLYHEDEIKAKSSAEVKPTVPAENPTEAEAADPTAGVTETPAPTVPATDPVVAVDRSLSAYEDAMRVFLAANGVAEADYTFLGGRYTQEEMQRIDEFLANKPQGQNGLITSASHMTRAMALAHKQGLALTSLPVDFQAGTIDEDPIFFIPRAEALSSAGVAIKEYISSWLP